MPSYLAPLQVHANGAINPSSFVRGDTTADKKVLQANAATNKLIGVSQPGSYNPPGVAAKYGVSGADPAAVAAGDPILVFTTGDVCGITVGSTAVTAWDQLTSDGAGNAVPAVSGNQYGAIALNSGQPGEIIECMVMYGKA